MNRIKLFHVIIVLFFEFLFSISSYSQGLEFILPSEAIDDFAPKISSRSDKDNPSFWVQNHKGVKLSIPYPENPMGTATYYVVYRYKFELSYLFGPGDFQWQTVALDKLRNLKQNIIQTGELKSEDIRVFPLTIPGGKQLESGWQDGNIVLDNEVKNFVIRKKNLDQIEINFEGIQRDLKDIESMQERKPFNPEGIDSQQDRDAGKIRINSAEELFQMFSGTLDPEDQELLNGLQGKAEKAAKKLEEKYQDSDGEGGRGQKGSGGFLPGYFSEWSVRVLRVIGEIFYPKLAKLVEQVLMAAYLIAPHIFERVGSLLGQIQDALEPDQLERVLDKATWIADKALEIYDYAQAAQKILKDPDLLKLAERLKIDDPIKVLKAVNVKLPPEVETFLRTVAPNGLLKLSREQFRKNIEKYAIKYGAQEALQRSRVPVLKDLDPEKAYEAIKSGNFDKFVKNEIRNRALKYTGPYGEAVDLAIEGKFEEAAKKGAAIEIHRQTGLSVEDIENIEITYNRMKRGEIKPEEVLKGAAAEAAKRALLKAGVDKRYINGFEKDGAAGLVSAIANEKGIYLSPDEIRSILSGNATKKVLEDARRYLKKVKNIEVNYDNVNQFLRQSLEWYTRKAEVISSKTKFVPADAFRTQKAHDIGELLKAVNDLKNYVDEINTSGKTMDKKSIRAIYKGDADNAYPELIGKFAENAKMLSPEAVSLLKQGKAEEAFQLELKNRAPVRLVSVSQEMNALYRQRAELTEKLLNILREKFTPEELDQLMMRIRMKLNRS